MKVEKGNNGIMPGQLSGMCGVKDPNPVECEDAGRTETLCALKCLPKLYMPAMKIDRCRCLRGRIGDKYSTLKHRMA